MANKTYRLELSPSFPVVASGLVTVTAWVFESHAGFTFNHWIVEADCRPEVLTIQTAAVYVLIIEM